MYAYPKPPLQNTQLINKMQTSGIQISDVAGAEKILLEIGYYRLKGYFFDLIDPVTKKVPTGTTFDMILKIYEFDAKLSHILFEFLTKIEIALRARLVDALSIFNDTLIYNDPSVFDDKEYYWKNQASIASEIAQSNDVFIKHNFDKHDGAIPIWAVVEVMSFGTLSKVTKTLKTKGTQSAYSILAFHYPFKTPKGNIAIPSKAMLSSWIQAVSVMRNICAHNSRIYNRSFTTIPKLIATDVINPAPKFNGVYQIILAMKYLRSSDDSWKQFVSNLNSLFSKYSNVVTPNKLHFPNDWANHLQI